MGAGAGQEVCVLPTRNRKCTIVPWGKEQSPDKKCKQILLPKLWTVLMQNASVFLVLLCISTKSSAWQILVIVRKGCCGVVCLAWAGMQAKQLDGAALLGSQVPKL